MRARWMVNIQNVALSTMYCSGFSHIWLTTGKSDDVFYFGQRDACNKLTGLPSNDKDHHDSIC